MVAVEQTFTESYPAVAASVARARARVVEYAASAGAVGPEIDAIRLAVSEAVTNAVRHAYPSATGDVHVTVAALGKDLWVLVADDGCGFQTPARSPGLGLGLALIADASDEFVIAERGQGGTEARMRFLIGAETTRAA